MGRTALLLPTMDHTYLLMPCTGLLERKKTTLKITHVLFQAHLTWSFQPGWQWPKTASTTENEQFWTYWNQIFRRPLWATSNHSSKEVRERNRIANVPEAKAQKSWTRQSASSRRQCLIPEASLNKSSKTHHWFCTPVRSVNFLNVVNHRALRNCQLLWFTSISELVEKTSHKLYY